MEVETNASFFHFIVEHLPGIPAVHQKCNIAYIFVLHGKLYDELCDGQVCSDSNSPRANT